MSEINSTSDAIVEMAVSAPHWGEYFALALNAMIDCVFAQRQRLPQIKENGRILSNLSWCKEFSTIRLNGPRRVGHSSAIARTLCRFESPVVLLHSDMARKYFKENAREAGISLEGVKIHTFRQDLHGYQPDAIFIDCSFELPKHRLEELYEQFGPGGKTLFILT